MCWCVCRCVFVMCACVYVCLCMCTRMSMSVSVWMLVYLFLHMHAHMTNPFVDACTRVHVYAGSRAQPTHLAVPETIPVGNKPSALQFQTVLPTGMSPWGDCSNQTTIDAQYQQYIRQDRSGGSMHMQSHGPNHGKKGAAFGRETKTTSRRRKRKQLIQNNRVHDSQLASLLNCSSCTNGTNSKSTTTSNISLGIPSHSDLKVNPPLCPVHITCQHCNTVLFSPDQQRKHYFEPIGLGPANRTAANQLGLSMDKHHTIPRCSALGAALIEKTFDSQYEAMFWFENYMQTTGADFVKHHNYYLCAR